MAIVGLVGFGLSLFEAPILSGAQIMMPSLVMLFWAMVGLSFGSLFAEVPQPLPADAPMTHRIGRKLQRACYWLVGALMIGLVISLLVLSYQLIRAWSML